METREHKTMTEKVWKKNMGSCLGCVKAGEAESDQFSRSWRDGWAPLAWRIPLLLWALVITTWSMASFWGSPPLWFLYMTHWGLILILMETSLGIFVAVKRPYGKIEDATFGLPWYVKTYWVLYNITIPVAFLITVFYWCILKTSSKRVNYAPNPVLDVMLHGVNSLVMLTELIFSAHPSRLLHVFQPLFFALAYLLFTVFYFLAGGSDPWGNPFIYPVIDWSKPDKTVVVAALTALFLALMHLFTVGVAALRDLVARRCFRDRGGMDNKGFVA